MTEPHPDAIRPMPCHPARVAQALADTVEAVIGVDTHTDTHSACLVSAVGSVLAECTAPASPVGYRQLMDWAKDEQQSRGLAEPVWVLEGSRSHGTGLARFLTAAQQRVLEATRPLRPSRRPGGKSDAKDALLAARSALAATHHGQPRVDGPREALRTLLVIRASAITARTDAINQLKSLILQAPDELRDRLRSMTSAAQIAACRRLRVPAAPPRSILKSTPGLVLDDAEHRTRVASMRRLANRIRTLTGEIDDAQTELVDLTRALAPGLLAETGIGPITTAQILVSWSHPKRLRNEAAFAALAGVSPIDASSGRQQRHRLNRNGDRALNRALHTIAVTRERCHPATKDYIARRLDQGSTRREARRMVKRYLARHIYRHLEAAAAAEPAEPAPIPELAA